MTRVLTTVGITLIASFKYNNVIKNIGVLFYHRNPKEKLPQTKIVNLIRDDLSTLITVIKKRQTNEMYSSLCHMHMRATGMSLFQSCKFLSQELELCFGLKKTTSYETSHIEHNTS